MTVLDVAPQVYYDAAVACNRAAAGFIGAFQSKMQSLDETRGMAGSIGDGKIWAESYDQQAGDLWKLSLDLTMALDGYAQVLNQAGYNHALADHDPAGGQPEPQMPTLTASFGYTALELISTLPTSAGGDGRGLLDDGLELAAKVGIPIPDGDTTKMSLAADVWHTLSTHESVAAVATELERAAAMFEQVTSPDADFIDEDLRELKTAAFDLAGAYGEMAQSCRDQKAAHDALRKELERLLGDLAKEIAVEVTVSLTLSVLASCVSFGVGGAAVAARTAAAVAKIIDKFTDLIKIAVNAAALRTVVVLERITSRTKEIIQRVKDLAAKLLEKVRNAGKAPGTSPTKIDSPQDAEEVIKAADRSGSGLKPDPYHRAASWPVDDIAENATVFKNVGGDGKHYTLVQMPGEVNGKAGRFEWIVDETGKVTHQLFVPNGTINGIPSKP
ncbi:hypothetical protein [Nocardia farcinica]|uniref:hypothetical protein n=1 Tax=Nocardia farcinica TaxID=37329 RepID=UPI0018950708|nr:hypothetical protein [Nocardia farcinica]MBF6070451.1 hypothetical protein [Nocardia farcinica]